MKVTDITHEIAQIKSKVLNDATFCEILKILLLLFVTIIIILRIGKTIAQYGRLIK